MIPIERSCNEYYSLGSRILCIKTSLPSRWPDALSTIEQAKSNPDRQYISEGGQYLYVS